MSKRLAAASIRHLPPGKHGDGEGLALVVQKSGSRSWVSRVTVEGTRRDIGLGAFPKVSLAEARKANKALRREAEAGAVEATPRERKARDLPTFGDAARIVFDQHIAAGNIENRCYADSWLRSLELHAAPLMDRRIDTIRTADVLAVLRPIWADKYPTARKVRHRMAEVFEWAMANYEDDVLRNPAGEHVKRGLPKVRNGRGHHEAIQYADLPGALEALKDAPASGSAKLCLRYIALTGVRSGEARGARWAEIDMDAAEWRIPAERMKARREHRVPLSDQALAVLEAAKQLDDGTGLVFPSPKPTGRPMAPQAIAKVWQHVHPSTVHGLRSAFRTWTLETTLTPWAVAEAALAHNIGNSVESAYIRSDAMEQRRVLMQAWADYCAPLP